MKNNVKSSISIEGITSTNNEEFKTLSFDKTNNIITICFSFNEINYKMTIVNDVNHKILLLFLSDYNLAHKNIFEQNIQIVDDDKNVYELINETNCEKYLKFILNKIDAINIYRVKFNYENISLGNMLSGKMEI